MHVKVYITEAKMDELMLLNIICGSVPKYQRTVYQQRAIVMNSSDYIHVFVDYFQCVKVVIAMQIAAALKRH